MVGTVCTLSACATVNLPIPLALETPAHLLGKKGYAVKVDYQVPPDLASYRELDGRLSNQLFAQFSFNYGLTDRYQLDFGWGGNSENECFNNDCESSSLTVLHGGIKRQLYRAKMTAASTGLKLSVASDSTTKGESGEVILVQLPTAIGIRVRSRKDYESKLLGRPRTHLGAHAYIGVQPFLGVQDVNGDGRGVLGVDVPHIGLGGQLSWFYLNGEVYLSLISAPVSDIRPGGSLSMGIMWD